MKRKKRGERKRKISPSPYACARACGREGKERKRGRELEREEKRKEEISVATEISGKREIAREERLLSRRKLFPSREEKRAENGAEDFGDGRRNEKRGRRSLGEKREEFPPHEREEKRDFEGERRTGRGNSSRDGNYFRRERGRSSLDRERGEEERERLATEFPSRERER